MGAAASKPPSGASNAVKRALPRAGATPIAPYAPSQTAEVFAQSPVERSPAEVKDLRLDEMMAKLTVRSADVSAVDFGYAAKDSRAKKRVDKPAEALVKPLTLLDELRRHRASGFAASVAEDIARERPKVNAQAMESALKHLRAHAFEEVTDEKRPGVSVRVGRW